MMNFSNVTWVWKLCQSRNLGLAFSIHKRPFPLAYYCGNESIIWCFSFPKPVPSLMLCAHQSMYWANQCTIHQHWNLTISEHTAPFSDMLHSQYAISTHLYQLAVYLNGGNKVCPQEPNHTSYIFISLHFPHHHHCTSTAFDWLLYCLLNVTPTASVTPLWKYKILDSQELQASESYLHAWYTVV
jgi:hypothetical protein